MTKGPRPAVTKSEQCWLHSASDPDPECIHCTAHEKVDDFTSHPGFAKLTDAVIAEMRWTCAHGNVYERWVATAACGCDRPTVETEGGL